MNRVNMCWTSQSRGRVQLPGFITFASVVIISTANRSLYRLSNALMGLEEIISNNGF